ncbi:ATP-binding protein, partial [Vibrio parahaemolyticus]
IKFTRNGSIDVNIGWVTTEEFGILRVAVADSGIGIPPDKFDRLFQPFSQVDSSLAREHDGMGLGLSICRRLVEAMGGGIGVSSKLGQGSTFW